MLEYFHTHPLIASLTLLLAVLWAKLSIYFIKKHSALDQELIKKFIPLARDTYKQKLKFQILVLAIAVIGIYLIFIIDFTSFEKTIAIFIINLAFATVIYLFLFFLILLINSLVTNRKGTGIQPLKNTYLMYIGVCILVILPLAVFTDIMNLFFFIFNFLLGVLGYRELVSNKAKFKTF